MNLNLILGSVGMLCILAAFAANEFYKKCNQDTLQYNILNGIGGGLLLIYALNLRSWPFVVLNAVWVLAAVVKLVKILNKHK